MKLHYILLLVAATIVSFDKPAAAQEPPAGWQLVWQDEFNDDKLDYSKWECEINAFGGGNNELQLYTDRKDNVRVENGSLIIEAHQARTEMQGTVRDFSSGRIRSKYRGDRKYGRFEFKVKLPSGQGVWPAIWMLPTDEKYGTWAASGEIDIIEIKGQEPNRIWGTLHYDDSWPNNKHTSGIFTSPNTDFTKDFHLMRSNGMKARFVGISTRNSFRLRKSGHRAGVSSRLHSISGSTLS